MGQAPDRLDNDFLCFWWKVPGVKRHALSHCNKSIKG